VKLINSHEYEILESRRGSIKFSEKVFLIGKEGGVYKRDISSASRSVLSTNTQEEIVSIVSDFNRYVEIIANDGKGLSIDLSSLRYDKKVANLKEGQFIKSAIGHKEDDCPDYVKSILRTKVSKLMSYERS
jgi:hypothetical protein